MRDSRAICFLCRARLSVQAAVAARPGGPISNSSSSSNRTPFRSQWHAAAGFSTRATPTDAGNEKSSNRGEVTVDDEGFGSISRLLGGSGERRPGAVAAQSLSTPKAPRRRRPRQTDDPALAVFRDIVEKQHQHDRAKLHRELDNQPEPDRLAELQEQLASGRPLTASMEVYNQLVKLTQMRSQPNVPIAAQFAFFEETMYPHMAHAPRELPNIFRVTAQQLVRDVSAAKQRDFRATDLPSAARITQIRRQFDLLNQPEPWVPLVLRLLEEILQVARNADSADLPVAAIQEEEDSSGAQEAAAVADRRGALLEDLVQTWRMFSLPDVVVADQEVLDQATPTTFRLPTPDPILLAKYARKGNFQLSLASLFPRYAPRQLRPLTPALLASYALLTDPAVTRSDAEEKAQEFLHAVAEILETVHIDRQAVADMFQAHPELGTYVLTRWPLVKQGPSMQHLLQSTTINHIRGGKAVSSLDSIHKQVSQALRARNLEACEAAWDRFWSAITVPDAEGSDKLRKSAEMFDYFIMAFTTMRMSNRAIAVWNLMTMAGVKPTLRTWTSFMEGCKRALNPAGIHSIWEKLMASGLQVDTAVWTARISGLIEAGEAEAGMRALEEMQQVWEASGGSGAAVKPTIEPVNAAIAGVLRRGDLAAAKAVLAWAGRHSIEPDLITFNTILRRLVREGRGDEVAGLLEMMRRKGLPPDEATVTILLDGALGGGALAGRNSYEQAEAVKQVLAAVEAAGLDANQQTYAKILYLLLQPGDNGSGSSPRNSQASAAVDVVLGRMRKRGLALSPHICTILAEHYFAQDPPDLAAVRALIEEGHPGVAGEGETQQTKAKTYLARPSFDRVFWERVVRGYAQVGDTASALRYFGNIADSQAVTSSTLEDLLRALIRSGEMDAAAQLVAKVQAQKTRLVQGGDETGARPARPADARLFRHRFWHLAAEHGLLQKP